MKFTPRTAALAGAVAAVAVSGALVAGPVFADDSTSVQSGTTSALPSVGSTDGQHMPDFDGDGPHSDSAKVGMRGGDHGGPMRGAMGGPMLHSEGVVARTGTSGTTYVSVRTQSGKVTAASDSSITVKSDDGYTKTWAIGSATVVMKNGATAKASTFAVGDIVMVSGTVNGDAVATTFVGSGQPGGRHGHGPEGMGTPGTLAAMPSTNA